MVSKPQGCCMRLRVACRPGTARHERCVPFSLSEGEVFQLGAIHMPVMRDFERLPTLFSPSSIARSTNRSFARAPPYVLPRKVEEFLRPGPKRGDEDCFLFALCLEDAYGSIDAVASGPDAQRLLPGNPSPEEFLSNEGSRRRVEELLAGLEGENGGIVTLRVRSYVVEHRHERVRGSNRNIKGYSIVSPSSLQPRSDLRGVG